MMIKVLKNLFCRIGRRLRVCIRKIRRAYWTPDRTYKSGKKLLAKIIREKPTDSIIVCAGPLMGDALYSMAFVEEYKRLNPQKTVLVWTIPKLKEIVSTFRGYDELVFIKPSLFEKMLVRIWLTPLEQSATDAGILNNIAYRRSMPEVNDITRLREHIFRIGPQAHIHYHQLTPEKVTCIPDFYKKCSNIVVLNPYSNSFRFPKKYFRFFEELAKYLTERGYTVYTNVIKDQLPIPCTQELRCGLAELLEIASHIPFIISVRSGILDFIVKTNVNMLVLYSEENINQKTYSMKAWECKGIVEETTLSELISDSQFLCIQKFIQDIDIASKMDE